MAIAHKTYAALVPKPDDLVGHVAYALYKRDKLKFCEEYALKNNHPPGDVELETFIHAANLTTRLQGYRTEAERLLETMAEYQLEDAIKVIELEANKELLRKLSEAKSWRRSIAEALVGSLAVAIVWAALVFVVFANKVGVEQMARDVWGIGLRAAPPSATGTPGATP